MQKEKEMGIILETIRKIKEYEGKIKEYEGKIKEYHYIPETKFGFMIDTIIQNEGIEEEPLWKDLLGLSQFAWRFHFKVWSMMENLEPIESLLTKSSEEGQMFLVIPRILFKSYGQIVAHPGEEAMHVMTIKDKNTFLLSENSEEQAEERRERTEYWFEEGAVAISWEHGQTGSMSREAVVEHRQAYPKVWTLLTVFFLVSVLLMIPLQQEFFPCHQEIPGPQEEFLPLIEFYCLESFFYQGCIFLIILFILCYCTTNIHNYSFYELRRMSITNHLNILLEVFAFPLIAVIVFISLFYQSSDI
jgi:hypothetical protein